MTIDGTLKVELQDDATLTTDRLNVVGTLTIGNAEVDFSQLTAAALNDAAYVFASYGSMSGSAFAATSNLPSGYAIDYDYGGNQIALVPVPEPATAGVIGLGAIGLGLRRRRRV